MPNSQPDAPQTGHVAIEMVWVQWTRHFPSISVSNPMEKMLTPAMSSGGMLRTSSNKRWPSANDDSEKLGE